MHPRATLRYARTAMRNKSGAGSRGARAKRARNESTPALRCATREQPCGTKAGRAVVERVQSERGTIAHPALRYATREQPCGTKAGRAVVERVQSERGTIAHHALRYATREQPCGTKAGRALVERVR